MMAKEMEVITEEKKTKKRIKEISFGRPQNFMNSAMSSEFPSLAEAAKMSTTTKRAEPSKPIEKETNKLITPYLNSFMNTRKDYTKPFFKELESDREFSKRNEFKPYYGYKKSYGSKVNNMFIVAL